MGLPAIYLAKINRACDNSTSYQKEVGDSLFVPGEDSQGRAAMAARAYGQYTGKKFTCRKEGAGCRIWRVDPFR